MSQRKIILIDEEQCNGCGLCVSPCAEGALQIVDGKAKVISDQLCDGAGFCLGVCPTGALTIEEREAPGFSEEAARVQSQQRSGNYVAQKCYHCGMDEDSVVVFPCRTMGRSVWVCAKCLPGLIHG